MPADYTASKILYFAALQDLSNTVDIGPQRPMIPESKKNLSPYYEFPSPDYELKKMQGDNDGFSKEAALHELHPQNILLDAAPVPSSPGTPDIEQQHMQQLSESYSSSREAQDLRSEVDVDTQANNVRARERVEILRGRVFRTRRRVQDAREDVRQFRERLREASAELMKVINQVMALENVQNLRSLQPLYKKTSDAQDELGPIEDYYDNLESLLNDQEQELEQEERHFYSYNNIFLRQLPDQQLDKPLSPLVKPYEPPPDHIRDVNLDNEQVQAYLAKMAEAQTLKEDLDEMEANHYKLSQESSFRKRHNLQLSRESASFLANYENWHDMALEKLHDVEDELYNLREQCLDDYLFREDEHVYLRRDALVEDIMDSVNEARERSPLRAAAQYGPSHHLCEVNFSDKRDYVNAWMLDWVQDSILEAHRLRAYIYFEYPHQGKELAGEEWSDLAIDWWDRDTAGSKANESYRLSQMDAITGDIETGIQDSTQMSSPGSFGSLKGSRSVRIEEEDFIENETIEGAQSTATERPQNTLHSRYRRFSADTKPDLRYWRVKSI